MTLARFAAEAIRVSPPWLRRTVGEKLMRAFGDVLDAIGQQTADGVRLRFPTDTADPGALALIGRERRIRRGPNESATTYARRLRFWWDAHRRRGSAYALLMMLNAYLSDGAEGTADLIDQNGQRYSLPEFAWDDFTSWEEAISVIERATTPIGWSGGGPDYGWAHVWIFFTFASFAGELVDDDDEVIVGGDGDGFVVLSPFDGTVSDEMKTTLRAIPREWNAAHIPFVTLVVLHGAARCWDYPVPLPAWDDWGTDHVWDEAEPVIFTTEDGP